MGILTSTIAAEVAGRIAWKPPVDVVAVANVASLSGLQTIDGVAGAEGLSVLLTAQTTGAQNGPYLMSGGSWTRRSDMDISSECIIGTSWRIIRGTQAGTRYYLSGPVGSAITLGTTALTVGSDVATVPANPSVTSLAASSFVSIGGTVASTGALRVASGFVLRGRNNANSADVDIIAFSGATDAIDIGDAADVGSITANVKTGGYFRVGVNGIEIAKIDNASGTKLAFTGNASISGNGNVAIQPAALFILDAAGGWYLETSSVVQVQGNATGLGFFAATPVAKPTVTGSRGGNAALASLLTALSSLGLLTDSSSA